MKLNTILEILEKNTDTYAFVRTALNRVEKALALYDTEKQELWVPFNGGKDATVVLHLLRLALHKKYSASVLSSTEQNVMKKANVVYFEEIDPFEDVDKFVNEQVKLYEFELQRVGQDFKKETGYLVQKYGMKAVLLGERDTDPHAMTREIFTPSDIEKGWEPFMRINPVLDWSYENVWKFLIDFEIPVCSLYKEGYTHLGNKNNTVKNPFLKKSDGSYLPAQHALGIHENYSRKSYKGKTEMLDCSSVLAVYDTIGEIDKLNKHIKGLVGKNMKSIHFIQSRGFLESQDLVKFLLTTTHGGDILLCYFKSLTKSMELLSLEKNERLKTMEFE
jgi:FAD synthetase